MKKLLVIVIIFFTAHFVIAQNCSGPNHSVNVNDSWVSCTKSQNPNPVRGNTHWVLYDLGYEYQIRSSHIWNYNVLGDTENGMKTFKVDYSLNGSDWIELSTWELQEASGSTSYEGEAGPNFGGTKCRYILFSSTESWGGICAGLSEVRFDVAKTVSIGKEVISRDIDLFPNPSTDQLTIQSDTQFEEFVIINTSGMEVYRGTFQNTIDISYLPQGVFFLRLVGNDGNLYNKEFVKQ